MSRTVGLIAAFGLGAVGCVEPELSSDSHAVVNGTSVPEGQDLAVVSLGGCTGSLIAPRVVLTANHCIGGSMRAYFGHDDDGDGPWIDAVDIERHDSVDLALLLLEEPGPVAPLPFNDRTLTDEMLGEAVRIVGFGTIGESSGGSGTKREGPSTMYDYNTRSLYLDDDGSKTCYGDSGGPYFMVFDGVEHVAAATKGATGTCEGGLSYGTRIDPHAAWVQAYIDEHDPVSCDEDFRCATDCPEPDPDCPCAEDGVCDAEVCTEWIDDPDCDGCGEGDTCRVDCPVLDPDCCAEDGICEALCGDTDPDCAPDDPPDGGPAGDDDDDDSGTAPTVSGGCRAANGGTGGALLFVALALFIAAPRRRR